ncbi:MAG: hypothetical protein WBN13_08575 [Robiginitalea sp.]|uniref:hypothetical protein n=1 Tax=Robiginitalea sp. TaxID=1902411 RepID=UPI003C77323B
MRTSFHISLLFTVIGLMSCSSQRKIQTEAPFTVERPTVEYWVGGREESGTQMRFQARWNPIDPSAITLDSLYFRGRVMKAESKETETGFLITATFIENWPKSDIIMHADARQEVGNQPPKRLTSGKDFPFDLGTDEAVLSYLEGNSSKKRYYRISGVVEKQGRISPERTKN